jgi:hypothetical protein
MNYNEYNDRTEIQVGDAIHCSEWPSWDWVNLESDNGFKDSSFPGCQFRAPMYNGAYKVAVNVTITGKVPVKPHIYRCKVEFVGDGEPSTFASGLINLID